MLKRIFFRLFWNTYDNLGAWLLISTAAFLLCLPILTAPAAWGGLLATAARADNEREITLRSFFQDVGHFAKRSTLLGLLLAVGLLLCAVNITFYAYSPLLARVGSLPRIVLEVVFFWIGLLWLTGVQIGWAFLAMQDISLRKALKRGFLVLLAHPLAVLASFFFGLAIMLILACSVIGWVVLAGALSANLVLGIAAGAVEHYDELNDKRERERLEREGARSWAERRAVEESEAARHRRYQRSWRELLRPWEMH